MARFKPEEAKTKPCPVFRFCVNEDDVLQNNRSAIYVHGNCVADECIVWRWTNQNTGIGYCGLGGKP